MPTPIRLAELTEDALDLGALSALLDDDGSGGVVWFVGRVRDHDHGQPVTALEYSAHPTATARLHEVCERVAHAHGVRALLAVHRLGTLEIGDIAVIVGVAAAHRDAAFTASRVLIDTLKAEVPIWKHQRFADGTDEWVAACLPAGDRPAS